MDPRSRRAARRCGARRVASLGVPVLPAARVRGATSVQADVGGQPRHLTNRDGWCLFWSAWLLVLAVGLAIAAGGGATTSASARRANRLTASGRSSWSTLTPRKEAGGVAWRGRPLPRGARPLPVVRLE